MNNNTNYVSLDLERIKEIIRDRLKVEPHNAGVCTEYKNSISIFNDRLLDLKNNDFYALVPAGYSKNNDGKWVYDMSNFRIYRITKDYVDSSSAIIDYSDLSKVTSIKLSEKLLNYSSREGLKSIETDTSNSFLSSKEFACLMLRMPLSGNQWLDNLINKANERDGKFL